VAVISPIASIIKIKKTAKNGKTIGPDTDNLKVFTQTKVAAGAALMVLLSKYPVAAEIIIPTTSPRTTAQDFIKGLPNRSRRIMVTHTLNPKPINSAEPQGSACLPVLLGQSWKGPVVGRP
jgi:hypothetical protein